MSKTLFVKRKKKALSKRKSRATAKQLRGMQPSLARGFYQSVDAVEQLLESKRLSHSSSIDDFVVFLHFAAILDRLRRSTDGNFPCRNIFVD